MTTFRARFIVLHAVGLGALMALWAGGLLDWIWADQTGMTAGIAVLFLVGVVCAAKRKWQATEWIGEKLVMLGLIGTVLGFIIALAGVDPETAKDVSAISPMVAQLISGLGTALYTTLIGSVGGLWLDFTQYLLDDA